MYTSEEIKKYQEKTNQFLTVKNPAEVEEVDELRNVLRFHEYQYYVLSAPLLDDYSYDVLYKLLQAWEKENPDEVPADSRIRRARYLFTGSTGVLDLNAYGRVVVEHGTTTREAYVQADLEASSRAGVRPNDYFRDGFAAQLREFVEAVTE